MIKIKYSPCRNPTVPETIIEVIKNSTYSVDGEERTVPDGDGENPDVSKETDGKITEERRTDGVIYLTIRRYYQRDCSAWDTGDYQTVTLTVEQENIKADLVSKGVEEDIAEASAIEVTK
jgi:hypothetical protein